MRGLCKSAALMRKELVMSERSNRKARKEVMAEKKREHDQKRDTIDKYLTDLFTWYCHAIV